MFLNRIATTFLASLLLAATASISGAYANCNPFPQGINDPLFPQEAHMGLMHIPQAWNRSTGAGVTIGIFSDGVTAGDPDLSGKVTTFSSIHRHNAVAFNGTDMALQAAGMATNGHGGVGVAPNARIFDVQITSDCTRTVDADALVEGLQAAQNAGVKIVVIDSRRIFRNNYPDFTTLSRVNQALFDFDAHGGLVFMGMGDEHIRDRVQSQFPHIIMVSGLYYNRQPTNTTNTGPAVWFACFDEPPFWSQRQPECDGTRFAAAQCAGVAALIWGANPSLSNEDVKRIMRQTAQSAAPNGFDATYGYGIPNAAAAVEAAGHAPSLKVRRASTILDDACIPANVERIPRSQPIIPWLH